MNETFVAERITELRLARGVSEYQMSLDLGQSKGYIHGIASGACMPSVRQLFHIADYFHMSMSELFDSGIQDSPAVLETVQILRKLSDKDVELMLELARRMVQPENGREF